MIRPAVLDDVPALRELIEASVRALSQSSYIPAQIDSALVHVLGIDTQLIADGTYYVIESDGSIVAAGGWSARLNPYGGDQAKQRDDPLLDPAVDAARIRAFYVDPAWTRRGLERRMFEACVRAGRARGFRR
jgi:GNAT superfamily N-acetyltransferase